MSDFRIDQITNQAGTAGPQIAGITTFSSTSGMLMPSGNTARRLVSDFVPKNIIDDGLVLYLDAGNSASYSGSGTTWTDLSGNDNNFTLYNTPTFSSSGGYINFDGTNQYARSSSTLDLSPYNSVTVEICFRVNTTSTPSGMAFEHSSDWNTQSMGFGLVPNSTGSTTYAANSHHTNQLNGERFDFDGTIGTNDVLFTLIRSKVSDSTGRLAYINSVQRNVLSGSTTTSSYPSFRNDFLYISSRNGSSVFANHRVYFLRIYGRKLSVTEVSQNFNALRSRYSI